MTDEETFSFGRARCEVIAHTADIGLRVTAPDRASLFEAAARGMVACIGDLVGRPGAEAEDVGVRIAATNESLLFRDWLAEVLFLVDRRRAMIQAVQFNELSATKLDAVVRVQPYDPVRSALRREVKAVTYHQLSVTASGAGFTAEVIFDI